MADQLEALVQKMIDAGESEENIAAVIREQSAKKPAQAQVRSRTGQMYTPYTDSGSKEFVGGAVGAVKDTFNPMTYVNLAKRAYNDPVGLAKDTAMAPIRLAGRMVTDPAETLGGLTAGAAMGKVLPGPRGAARGVGTAIETVGQKGAWPIRMVGSHTLGAGNPLGAAMVAAPEAIEGIGTKLRQWGENDPILQADAIKKFHGGEKPKAVPPEPLKVAEGKNVEDAWDRARRDDNGSGGPGGGGGGGNSGGGSGGGGRYTPEELDAMKRQGYSPDVIERARKAAGGPIDKSSGKMYTPGQTRGDTGVIRVTPKKSAEAPSVKPAIEEGHAPGEDVTRAGTNAVDMGNKAAAADPVNLSNADVQMARGKFGPEQSKFTLDKQRQDLIDTANRPSGVKVEPSSNYERMMENTPVPDIEVVEGGGKPTAARMPIRLAAPAKAGGAVPDEWLDAVDNAVKRSGSKSRSFMGTKLSPNDVQQALTMYRADPTLNPELAAERLEMLRSGRAATYRESAGLDAGYRRSIEGEEK